MSWVLYDPPPMSMNGDGDVEEVIITVNRSTGQDFGIFHILQAVDQYVDLNLYTELGAYDPAVSLADKIAGALASISDITTAGVSISPTANAPNQYGKVEGVDLDGDEFEEIFVGVRNVRGELRYTLFIDSGTDDAYDRRVELGKLDMP